MKIQDDNYSCGACSILNVMEALGIEVDLARIERLADTTRQGTDEVGIKDALDALGVGCQVIASHGSGPVSVRGDWFYGSISRAAAAGDPVIVYSKPREHWFAVVGTLGDRLNIWDSDNSPENVAVNGSYTKDKDGLIEMTGDMLYALRVVPPQPGFRIS